MAEKETGVVAEAECKHGLTVRTCDMCLGALRKAPYRQHMRIIQPGYFPEVDTRQDCEVCPTRGPSKGNRVFVRLPRPPRSAFGKNIPNYPPSWQGPLVERPRIWKATHKNRAGQWVCDRCDPKGVADRKPIRHEPKKPGLVTLGARDIFGQDH